MYVSRTNLSDFATSVYTPQVTDALSFERALVGTYQYATISTFGISIDLAYFTQLMSDPDFHTSLYDVSPDNHNQTWGAGSLLATRPRRRPSMTPFGSRRLTRSSPSSTQKSRRRWRVGLHRPCFRSSLKATLWGVL